MIVVPVLGEVIVLSVVTKTISTFCKEKIFLKKDFKTQYLVLTFFLIENEQYFNKVNNIIYVIK